MRLVQLGDLHHGWAFPPGWAGAAVEIANQAPHLAMHNRPYDQRVLKRHAPGWRQRWEATEDTLPAAHICDSLRPAGLKPRSVIEVDPRAALGEQLLHDGMAANHWTWDTVPGDWEPYWTYSALDPVLTAHLWQKFAPQVTGPYREAYDLEKAVTRISAQMMDTGMAIDVPFIEDAMERVNAYHATAMDYLSRTYGIRSVNSGEQVMHALNAAGIPTRVWTPSGQPQIDKQALSFYAAEYPQHRDLVQCVRWARKAGDISGKYLAKFLALHVDGTMHYSINTCRARTSRMSVTDPPMQTFDRDEPVIRGSFIPRSGHVFISIDADQIEMRLAAHFSRDPNLIQDFKDADASGQSFFVLAASRIFGETIAKSDPRYSRTKNACVPLSTQILTKRGWLSHDQVKPGDETIGLNLATGHSEWTSITAVHQYADTPVQSFGNSDRFRLSATPDHRWPVLRTYGKHREEGRLELVGQQELNRHRDTLILSMPLDDAGTVQLTDTEARVLGWLLSDGTLKVSYDEVRVSNRKITGEIFQTEKKYAAEIRELLRDVPHRADEPQPGYHAWHLRPEWLRGLLAKTGLYWRWPAAEVLACSLGPASRLAVAETMRKADGDPFVKGDRWRADFYATLLYLNGETPRIRVKQDCWAVGRTKPTMTMQRVTVRDEDSQPVWCVTTGLGTWTSRTYDGFISLTGNSYGQIYGASLGTAAATAGVPVRQMEEPYYGFRRRYPGVFARMDQLIREGKRGGRPYATAIDGRKLYVHRGHEYAIHNTELQGSAAVILKRGLVDLDAAGLGGYLRLTLHDEYLLEVPRQDARDVLRKAEEILTDRETFRVPITWSGKILDQRWVKS